MQLRECERGRETGGGSRLAEGRQQKEEDEGARRGLNAKRERGVKTERSGGE